MFGNKFENTKTEKTVYAIDTILQWEDKNQFS